ncbi:hypothetical protein HID58_046625 [Brassica napus]|uniref:MYND-type domain-containing protein n=1 Tax=Brassica napus TaxID=3708 RepID=A0ABQ8AX22_BRANA|nr:hypothetical protein HID58_046625 [Brassica napus]
MTHLNKKPRLEKNLTVNHIDDLPDDLVFSILRKLSSSASCPADFFNVLITCKRLNRLGLHPLIRFYCLQNPVSGASLMARAAIKSHAPALYSLSVIQFNGSGGNKSDKNLRAGVALCARSAYLGHVDALRELGHCLQDGYGVPRDVAEGRRLLIQANARELAGSLRSYLSLKSGDETLTELNGLPVHEIRPVNRFLKDWFDSGRVVLAEGLRMCSHGGCGRPETRSHEFRRCSVCGKVNYCSRGCQALDWRVKHKMECAPLDLWVGAAAIGVGDEDVDAVEVENHAAR